MGVKTPWGLAGWEGRRGRRLTSRGGDTVEAEHDQGIGYAVKGKEMEDLYI